VESLACLLCPFIDEDGEPLDNNLDGLARERRRPELLPESVDPKAAPDVGETAPNIKLIAVLVTDSTSFLACRNCMLQEYNKFVNIVLHWKEKLGTTETLKPTNLSKTVLKTNSKSHMRIALP
jgi:hypothetical protein